MKIHKEQFNFGHACESEYSCAQAIRVADTLYVSDQVGHEEAAAFCGIEPS